MLGGWVVRSRGGGGLSGIPKYFCLALGFLSILFSFLHLSLATVSRAVFLEDMKGDALKAIHLSQTEVY